MSYIDKIKKDGVIYDIHDARGNSGSSGSLEPYIVVDGDIDYNNHYEGDDGSGYPLSSSLSEAIAAGRTLIFTNDTFMELLDEFGKSFGVNPLTFMFKPCYTFANELKITYYQLIDYCDYDNEIACANLYLANLSCGLCITTLVVGNIRS